MRKNVGKALSAVVGIAIVGIVGFVVFVKVQGPRALQFPETPYPKITASKDPAVIERGRYLVENVSHCTLCHGNFRGESFSHFDPASSLQGGYEVKPPFGVFRSTNLTPDPETGLGAWTDGEIARTIQTGVRRTGELSLFMRLTVGQFSDEDLTAIVSFLRSRPPIKNAVAPSEPNFMALAMVALTHPQPKPADVVIQHVSENPSTPTLERGKYLARGPALCLGCHTHMDPTKGFVLVGQEFAGGDPHLSEIEPGMEYAAPNLTSHPKNGILAKFTEDQFVARIRAGRRLNSIMPWENFKGMTESDLRSVYRYLQSVPVVDADNGPVFRKAGWKPGDPAGTTTAASGGGT